MIAYLEPHLETKRLEIFQKMIEGTQALLQRQMKQTSHSRAMKQNQIEVNKFLVDKKILFHPKKQKIKSPQQSISHRRRIKPSKQVEIIETPMETPVHESILEPLQETVEES